MNSKRMVLAAGVLLALACHGNDKAVRKDQQYNVVQEGQASGVTSTINGPGEQAAASAPLTGTNADTTTNFALPTPGGFMSSAGPQAGTQPGTLASSMPAPTTGAAPMPGQAVARSTAPPQPRPLPRAATGSQTVERPMTSSSTYTPRPATQTPTTTQPPATDTAAAPKTDTSSTTEPPATDTTGSTEKKPKDQPANADKPKSDKTDTTSTQPPADTPPPPPM